MVPLVLSILTGWMAGCLNVHSHQGVTITRFIKIFVSWTPIQDVREDEEEEDHRTATERQTKGPWIVKQQTTTGPAGTD